MFRVCVYVCEREKMSVCLCLSINNIAGFGVGNYMNRCQMNLVDSGEMNGEYRKRKKHFLSTALVLDAH